MANELNGERVVTAAPSTLLKRRSDANEGRQARPRSALSPPPPSRRRDPSVPQDSGEMEARSRAGGFNIDDMIVHEQ